MKKGHLSYVVASVLAGHAWVYSVAEWWLVDLGKGDEQREHANEDRLVTWDR
jgi:hypothetical protein